MVDNDKIVSNTFDLRVGEGCNALYEIMLFLSAVLAFEAPLYSKIYGAGFGIIFIYVLNLIRIAMLFFIGIHLNEYFKISHDQVFQSLFVGIVAILWLFWAATANKHIGFKGTS